MRLQVFTPAGSLLRMAKSDFSLTAVGEGKQESERRH